VACNKCPEIEREAKMYRALWLEEQERCSEASKLGWRAVWAIKRWLMNKERREILKDLKREHVWVESNMRANKRDCSSPPSFNEAKYFLHDGDVKTVEQCEKILDQEDGGNR